MSKNNDQINQMTTIFAQSISIWIQKIIGVYLFLQARKRWQMN
jgi:hypothetical protein